jgi:hypothetical protein
MSIRMGSACVLCSALVGCMLATSTAPAQTIWSGFTKSFSKPSGADGSLPENQDTLTEDVIFARGFSNGIYNAASESFYSQFVSPENTLWATELVMQDGVFPNEDLEIAATNWEALTFTDWVDAFGGPGSFMLPNYITSYNAVVRLLLGDELDVSDDVFLDIQFTYWGGTGDAGFTYMRGEPSQQPILGDFDDSGAVENGDLTLLLNNWGQAVPPVPTGWNGLPQPTEPAIDNDELTALLNNWGATAGTGSGASTRAVVPEPASSLIASLATVWVALYRRRRQRDLSVR